MLGHLWFKLMWSAFSDFLAQRNFHPWYLMHWCDEINYMLHLVPPVIFKQIYREHDMLADGLFKQNGYGTFFETLDGMVKNMANLLAAEFFSAFDISVFDVMLYHSCWDFFNQLVLLWIVCLRSPPIHSIFWPEDQVWWKKSAMIRLFLLAGCLYRLEHCFVYVLKSNGTLCSSWGNYLYVMTTL